MNNIYHGNCLDYIPLIENKSISLLLTDPSFGLNYQSNRRVKTAKRNKLRNDTSTEIALDLIINMLDLTWNKLADNAHILIFGSSKLSIIVPFMEKLNILISKTPYILTDRPLTWVWNNHTTGNLYNEFAPQNDIIYHLRKGKPLVRPRVRNVINIQYKFNKTTGSHPTRKPIPVLEHLILPTTSEGDLVFDPFMGSGTIIQACYNLKRNFIGAEIDNEYFQLCQTVWNECYPEIKEEIA